MLSEDERKLKRHLMHNEAQRRSHKKMIMIEKNKKRGKKGRRKPGNVMKGGLNSKL